MRGVVAVKLGGSVITDKTRREKARLDVIKRLSEEMARAAGEGVNLLVGNGGGSFPHYPAAEYRVKEGLTSGEEERRKRGYALTQDAAARLNRIVVSEMLKAGLKAVSLQPSAFMVAMDGKPFTSFLEPLKLLLKHGFTPVVYGDAVLDLKRGFTILSTEEILCHLARKLGIKRIVVCADVDGVLDANGKTIPLITPANFPSILKSLRSPGRVDVTGGMRAKVLQLLRVAVAGVESVIVNGLKPGELYKALTGKPTVKGTVIKP